MKIKRFLLVLLVVVSFAISFYIINTRYDRLSRYPYHDEVQNAIIREKLSDSEIDYIVEYSIYPGFFIRYIDAKGFNIYHIDSYNALSNSLWYLSSDDVVSYTEKFLNMDVDFEELILLFDNGYAPADVLEFYRDGSPYTDVKKLLHYPGNLDVTLGNTNYIYKYVPNHLVNYSDGIEVRREVLDAFNNVCVVINDEFAVDNCGGIEIERAYLNYYECEALFLSRMSNFAPGYNEHQLGLCIDIDFTASIFMEDNEYNENFDRFKEIVSNKGFIFKDCYLDQKHLRFIGVNYE